MHKKNFNVKGYMLIEIILASAIAFTIAYFVIEMTLHVKTRNDDVYAKSIVSTDQSIITNGIMQIIEEKGHDFNCNKLKINGNQVLYDGKVINDVNDFAKIDLSKLQLTGKKICEKSRAVINIHIPIVIKQIPKKNFDVDINYKYIIPKVKFNFLLTDIKRGTHPAAVDYEIQIKTETGEWISYGATGKSSNNGEFKASLSANNVFRVKTSGGGYPEQFSQEFSSLPGNPTNINIYVFNGDPNEILMVLSWDDKIKDLDAHLIVYKAGTENVLDCANWTKNRDNGGRRYYSKYGNASLELDNTDRTEKEIPETISIDRNNYDFVYFVHNYSKYNYNFILRNNSSLSPKDLYAASPKVSIFDGGGENGTPKWYEDHPLVSDNSDMTWIVFKYSARTHEVVFLDRFSDKNIFGNVDLKTNCPMP